MNEIGELELIFSEKMFLEEIFEDFNFKSETKTEADQDDEEWLRNLQSRGNEKISVELQSLIQVKVLRGSADTSAPRSKLNFIAELKNFDSKSLLLKLSFEHPLSVSIGEKADIIQISFVEPDLFVSAESGKKMEANFTTISAIPKQFPDEESFSLAVAAGNTVQVAANTAFLSQFEVTICLAVSLKAMWNLMHIMQLMAYLRLLVEWPANSEMMLKSMHNAITLENIFNAIFGSDDAADFV